MRRASLALSFSSFCHSALAAESVAVAEDGSLYMLDKFGYVWRAPKTSEGGYTKDKEPLAHLGPGRPLGFHFDAEGNLIVCDAGAVRPHSKNFPTNVQVQKARQDGSLLRMCTPPACITCSF